MTDNYNDDYREVIPEEEKTETNVSDCLLYTSPSPRDRG